MADNAVIVFLRVPEPGQVKTRLAKDLDQNLVLELYEALVRDTLESVSAAGSLVICFTPERKAARLRDWLGIKAMYLAQTGNDLGQRMSNAFQAVFSKGFKKAVLIGTDIPQLDEGVLRQAFEKLDHNDTVIGPSADGGYYLIGSLKDGFCDSIFKDMDWSTPGVFEQTLTAIKEKGMSVGLLKVLNDIDTIDDFRMLQRLPETGAHIGRYTRIILSRVQKS